MAEEDSFEKVKKGLKETGEGLKEGVEETAESVKETAEEITDPDTYTESDVEMRRENAEYNETGGKEPMNPEDIASHEPTAVKRDKKQGTSGDPV